MSALRAGVARRVINPPFGIKRPGIRLFADPIQAIESDLTATVLVLAAGGSRAAIVACDLCAIPVSVVDRLRLRIAAVLDTTVDHVLVNESHTHSGPALPEFIPEPAEQAAVQQAYQDEMEEAVVQAAQQAGATLQPARIGAGWGECGIGAYRRDRLPDGTDHLGEVAGAPTDPSVGVVRVDDLGGRPIATLFSYGCHPVTMGPHSHVASSDFPGAARAVVEGALGGTALFLQACGGNINPVTGIGAEVDCRDNKDRIGAMLGGEVVKVAAGIRTHVRRGAKRPIDTLASVSVWPWEPVLGESESTLAAVERTLELDFVELPPARKAQEIHDHWHRELAEAESAGGHHWDVAIAKRFAHWAERLVAAVRDGSPRFPMPVQVLRVGDVAWVGVGAEVFFETGLTIKASSPISHTQVLGYSAGCRTYLPRAEDYPEGGWDIDARYAVPDLFFQAYSMPVALRPDSADRVTEAALELLREAAVG
ncbi:MAG: neutral/alkaline non-lysosomal ceramidase N-terminal domain-containing protein [Spirochaetaceae bacterium]|nr:neutral/alkaline non-lysosomal ceramidase N-terminal domain-containing protein [Spirochaetaceae bacterium]